MEISISEQITKACPGLELGLLSAEVRVGTSDDVFWKEAEKLIREKANLDFDQIKDIDTVKLARKAYKALGKDPSRYRLSAEALHRRLVKGRSLYKVNNIVDIINLISLKSGISIGGYDLDKIKVPVILAKGKKEDEYRAIGRGAMNIENLPVLFDSKGPFGSPTSDSERTMITLETKKILLVFFNFGKAQDLRPLLNETAGWLKRYTGSTGIELVLYDETGLY